MVRARLAQLAVVVGLGLATGCASSWSPHSLFSRLQGNHEGPCCDGEGPINPEGPVLGESGPFLVPPGINGGSPSPVPPGSVPSLTTPPGRLVPQPQAPQATPMPYNP